jgi:hypothetical protein
VRFEERGGARFWHYLSKDLPQYVAESTAQVGAGWGAGAEGGLARTTFHQAGDDNWARTGSSFFRIEELMPDIY